MTTILGRGAILMALGIWLLAWPAGAEAPAAAAAVEMDTAGIRWQPAQRYASLQLTISGPGLDWARTFAGTEPALFQLNDLDAAALADGDYNWELTVSPEISVETRERMAALRDAPDRGMGGPAQAAQLPTATLVQSGSFAVVDGSIVLPRQQEPPSRARRMKGE